MSVKKKLSAAFNKASKAWGKIADEFTLGANLGLLTGMLAMSAAGIVGLPAAGIMLGGTLAGKFAAAKLGPNSIFNRHPIAEAEARKARNAEYKSITAGYDDLSKKSAALQERYDLMKEYGVTRAGLALAEKDLAEIVQQRDELAARLAKVNAAAKKPKSPKV